MQHSNNYIQFKKSGLFGASKAKPILAKIKFCVIDPKEHISKDPERADSRGKVDAHEATETQGLATLRNLQGYL